MLSSVAGITSVIIIIMSSELRIEIVHRLISRSVTLWQNGKNDSAKIAPATFQHLMNQ